MKRISRRKFFQSAGIIAAAPALGALPASAEDRGAADIKVEKDIVFGKGGDMDLLLDVYHPSPANAKRMAIVHLYGGGFFTGSKTGVTTSSRAFAGQGYVSVASTYRLTGQARWPAQIEDVKAAIRWTRANADRLGVDADKIGVAGYSAGGMLALFAAGTSDRPEFEGKGGNAGVSSKVAACVAFYPATSATRGLMPDGADDAARAAASPGTYISANFAPTIFLHGLADTTIPYKSSVAFFDKLREAGVKVDLHLFQGAPHAFEANNPDAALAAAQVSNLFLDRVVVNPKEYPPFGFGRGGRGPGQRGGRKPE
ncbi:MAG TPA: alpha/beta hydrolase [Gammaproteobacteria bacterium]|nr:alpha/beta hydrolase [Gammaproteobacteria bacterium]